MPIENELKLTCPECGEKVATIRTLEGNVQWVYCEPCDKGRQLEVWLEQHQNGRAA